MPFGFGKKKVEAGTGAGETRGARSGPSVAAADALGARPIRFRGLTEEWRLDGQMEIHGRLVDTLNHRNAIPLSDVSWAPLDGSSASEPAPGIQAVDPYDLIVVIAGPDSLSARTEQEVNAHRIHKIAFDVALEAPPYRVVGTVQLHPGSEPEGLLERSSQMFVAVTNPVITMAGVEIGLDNDDDVALVNRFYLRGVEQVDLATGIRHQRLPGSPLGGTNWRERA
ncbi:MAG: hypothetical protein ABIV26_01690 [Candidatus Limnocylindrales bacterium]